jgi:hypothetical protein
VGTSERQSDSNETGLSRAPGAKREENASRAAVRDRGENTNPAIFILVAVGAATIATTTE